MAAPEFVVPCSSVRRAHCDATLRSCDRPVHDRPRRAGGLWRLPPAAGTGPADRPQRVSARGRHRSRHLRWHDRVRRPPFYLSPIAAVATIIAASAMPIFSGNIPGALLRIPGTPASAAYTDEAYAMTRKGQPELALGICVWFSALGGIAGTISLMALAPPLAEMALNFSTYEYFWLAFLGLMWATLVARSSPVKAIAAMLLGLLVSCIGMENPAGTPRFTFGITDLLGGIEPIPALVGVFAVTEVMRAMLTPE